jgi:hypothetical protein
MDQMRHVIGHTEHRALILAEVSRLRAVAHRPVVLDVGGCAGQTDGRCDGPGDVFQVLYQ